MSQKKTKRSKGHIAKNTKIEEVANFLPEPVLPREFDDRFPKIHHLIVFIGKSRSGKSNFIANWMMKDDMIGMAGDKPMFETVHIISPSIQTDRSMQLYQQEEVQDRFMLYTDIQNIESIVRHIVAGQDEFDPHAEDPAERPPHICIYIDDCSEYINKSNFMKHFFTVYRHHNISVILSLQNIKGMPPICRAQATGVFLGQCYSENERDKIAEHWADNYKGKRNFFNLWNDACSDFYQFFYLKLDDYYPRCFVWGGKEELQEYHGIYPEQERKAGNLDYLRIKPEIKEIDENDDDNKSISGL